MGRSEDESSLSDPLLPEKNVHYSATRDTDSRRATAFSDPSLSEEERQERDDREETQEREEMFDRRKRGGKGQEQRRQSGKSEGFCVGGRAEPGSSHETAKIPQVRSFKRGAAALARSRRLPWIVIDDEGRRSYLFADKRSLISKAGLFIPPRDTRLLDFSLVGSSQSTILVRDNAIIAAIEHVRFCVTADRVIIPREGAEMFPMAAKFVNVLEEAISDWVRHRDEYMKLQEESSHVGRQESLGIGSFVAGNVASSKRAQDRPDDDSSTTAKDFSGGQPKKTTTRSPTDEREKLLSKSKGGDLQSDSELEESSSQGRPGELPPLPFELVVLEAALKEIASVLVSQTKDLEGVAVPALDSLMRSVSSTNLERVRRVKTRHQRLMMRCEALRDELQRFLQDDEDMSRMCLTRRKEAEENSARMNPSYGQLPGPDDADRGSIAASEVGAGDDAPLFSPYPSSFSRRASLSLGKSAFASAGSPPKMAAGQTTREAPPSNINQRSITGMGGITAAALAEMEAEADAEAQLEVENLLESYYMEIDALYDKLKSLGEYAEDTEEYIDIELDSSRNRLIRIEIILTLATFCIVPWNLLAGILGENLPLPEQITTNVGKFFLVNTIAGVLCLAIFYGVMIWMKRTKLL